MGQNYGYYFFPYKNYTFFKVRQMYIVNVIMKRILNSLTDVFNLSAKCVKLLSTIDLT